MRRITPSSRRFVVDPILLYAVWGHFIVGTTPKGYFILDTAVKDDASVTPNMFAGKAEWEAALAERVIPRGITLCDPHEVARSRPNRELYPEDYVFMDGLLGLSDGQWSCAIQAFAIATCLVMGLCKAHYATGILGSVVSGIAASITGQAFIEGGGPGFLVGVVVLPVFCFAGWGVGRTVRFILYRAMKTKT